MKQKKKKDLKSGWSEMREVRKAKKDYLGEKLKETWLDGNNEV